MIFVMVQPAGASSVIVYIPGAIGPLFQVIPSVKLKPPGDAEVTNLNTSKEPTGQVTLLTLMEPGWGACSVF